MKFYYVSCYRHICVNIKVILQTVDKSSCLVGHTVYKDVCLYDYSIIEYQYSDVWWGGGDKKGKGEKIYIHDTHTEQRLLLLLF